MMEDDIGGDMQHTFERLDLSENLIKDRLGDLG
jgi:hypothetical protein